LKLYNIHKLKRRMTKENFDPHNYWLCVGGISGENWIKSKVDWKGDWILHLITCRFRGLADAWR
jgi:hypothetical protein